MAEEPKDRAVVEPAAAEEGALPRNTPVEKEAQKPKKARRRFWRHKDVNRGEKSFAEGLNGYKIIWVFILGCVIGVFFETLYVFFMDGVWMRRSGMLYGPYPDEVMAEKYPSMEFVGRFGENQAE